MMSVTVAPREMKLSIFSEMSNTTATHTMRKRARKNVPINFRRIYQSSFFNYSLLPNFSTIMFFHSENVPSAMC